MKWISLLNILLVIGCDKLFKDDQLSLPQTPYTGNQLRIDGFYYEALESNTFFSVYIFYHNGTLISAGAYPNSTLEKVIESLNDTDFSVTRSNNKSSYGRFSIENDSIRFERWYPGSPPLPAYVRAGNIINDTTFVINESYRMKNGSKTEVTGGRNEIYHFKQLSPKPDSTNLFVP